MLKTELPDIIGTYSTGFVEADFTDIEADDHASSGGGPAVDTESKVLDWLHDKDVFPDNFFLRLTAPVDELNTSFRFGYVNNSQTPAAAIIAGQWLTAAISPPSPIGNTAVKNTYVEGAPLAGAKIPEGGLVFLWHSRSSALTNTVGMCGFRYTERIVDQ